MQTLLKSWTFRIAAAVVAVLLAFVVSQQLTLNSVRKDLATSQRNVGRLTESLRLAVETNAANAEAYQTSTEQLKAARAIAEEERVAARQRERSLQSTIDAIRRAPPQDRAPVSPVVRDTIDRLWPEEPEQ